jgi:hypothetical protein
MLVPAAKKFNEFGVLLIRHLDVEKVAVSDLCELVKGLTSVRLILINSSNLKSTDLELIAKACSPKVSKFAISNCPLIANNGVESLAKALGQNLTYLWLLKSGVGPKGILGLVEHAKNLRALEFYDCKNFTDKAVGHIVRKCPSLQSIHMEGCSLTNKLPNFIEENLDKVPLLQLVYMTKCGVDEKKEKALQRILLVRHFNNSKIKSSSNANLQSEKEIEIKK